MVGNQESRNLSKSHSRAIGLSSAPAERFLSSQAYPHERASRGLYILCLVDEEFTLCRYPCVFRHDEFLRSMAL
jgi:hypothetical protein